MLGASLCPPQINLGTPGNEWLIIAGATSATYTPVDDDVDDDAPLKSDEGRYLLAVVSYTDAKRNLRDDEFAAVPFDMAGLVSDYPVAEDTRNRAPVFERPGYPWHAEPVCDERGGGEH